ncbi:MAG: hypothetical protein ABIV25_09050 [Paracoccaceae bacterium]
MELNFSDTKVRDLCCSHGALVAKFGAVLARKICCRLALLAAARSLADVPAAFPVGLLARDTQGRFSVALGPSQYLLFQVILMEGAKMSDLSLIAKVQIIGVVAVSEPTARRS